MSLKDLEADGLLKPREEWGKEDPHTDVNVVELVISWILSAVSFVLMYIGDGNTLTWIGLGIFFISLGLFTYLSVHAINVRAEHEAEKLAERDS
ncbi:MAG: hypothetical protein ACLFWB_04150 [Armatimonadota bacterium]